MHVLHAYLHVCELLIILMNMFQTDTESMGLRLQPFFLYMYMFNYMCVNFNQCNEYD